MTDIPIDEPAQISSTGYQFFKNGIPLNFFADTQNKQIVLVGKSANMHLSIDDARNLVTMLNNLIILVSPPDPSYEHEYSQDN